MLPIRTFPASLVVAGARTGGNAGLMLPIRTFVLSEMTVRLSRVSILVVSLMEGSICSAERHCSGATRRARAADFVKTQRVVK